MRRDHGDLARLRNLVEGRDWARLGTNGGSSPTSRGATDLPENDESPANAELSDDGRGWFRTSDLSRVKRALSH